jgi:hypothetical protein
VLVPTADPSLPERRRALLNAARLVMAETGHEGAALVHPELAESLAQALSEDMGRAIEQSTARVETLAELVDALVEAVIDRAIAWRDGLGLANAAIERLADFEAWSATVAPWVGAIERAVSDAQQRGVVRDDVDPAMVALVLRDTLDRMAKAAILFGRDGYRATAATLVRASLRA